MNINEQIQSFIIQKLSDATGSQVDAIKPDMEFTDLGLNSFQITELVTEIEKTLDVDIDLGAMFEFSNIRSFAQYLTDNFPDKVSTLTVPSC